MAKAGDLGQVNVSEKFLKSSRRYMQATPTLSDNTQKLLEEYSRIPKDEVQEHLMKIVS